MKEVKFPIELLCKLGRMRRHYKLAKEHFELAISDTALMELMIRRISQEGILTGEVECVLREDVIPAMGGDVELEVIIVVALITPWTVTERVLEMARAREAAIDEERREYREEFSND